MIQFIEVTPSTRQPADPMLIGVAHIISVDRNRNQREGAVLLLDGRDDSAGGSNRVPINESYADIRAMLGLEAPPDA